MPATFVFIVRIVAALTIVLLALFVPQLGVSLLRTAESQLYLFAQRRWLTVVSVAILAVAANAAIGLANGIPRPWISDEFGHLLAADTFASGRLSNPTHPMWMHFESFQINQKPTYVSKYPPAQGLILAAGQIMSGQPIAGVWLSAGLACGAICWMLQGWFRPGVALAGALLAVSRIGVTTYWSHTYWGGMVAALAGALAFGALKRVLLRPQIGTSVVLGIGLAILANSRPYEGFLASIPVFVVLAYRTWRSKDQERSLFLRRVAMPVCGIGVLTLLWMGYYNFRQTGNALLTAYQVYTNTYQMQPIFTWERFRDPPAYRDPVMREAYTLGAGNSSQYEHRIQTYVPSFGSRVLMLWGFYCGVAFSALLIMALFYLRSYAWCALASVALVVGGLLLGSRWLLPHYAAPVTAPFFILMTYGWSRLRSYRFRGRRTGLFLARITLTLCVALFAARTLALSAGLKHIKDSQYAAVWLAPPLTAWTPVPVWPSHRQAIEQQLERSGGTHLILVRYAPNHRPEDEWIYNKADIDGARVVWARDMGPAQDRSLLDYFHSRHVWLLEADQPDPKLVPYPPLAPKVATSSYVIGRTPRGIQSK